MALARELTNFLDVYNDRSDAELQALHENRDDLTDLAQQALAQVMKERGLSVTGVPVVQAKEEDSSDPGSPLQDGEAVLESVGSDAFSIREAIRLLEEAEIPHRVAKTGDARNPLALVVKREDEARASALLQDKMKLFPDMDRTKQGAREDIVVLGDFKRADALQVGQALGAAGVSYVWSDGRDNTTLEEDEVRIEVYPSRAEEAAALAEKLLG
jgi:hypothetical protein